MSETATIVVESIDEKSGEKDGHSEDLIKSGYWIRKWG
jgi:hypothetical protein